MPGPLARWEKHIVLPMVANQVLSLNPGDAFYIGDQWAVATDYKGIYYATIAMAIKASTGAGGLDQIDSHLIAGDLIKLTGNAPQGPGTPDPRTGQTRVWVPNHRYMTDDQVILAADGYAVYYRSLLDNNIQTVFQENWEAGAITPPNQLWGMFTVPGGSQKNRNRARKIFGAPYYARDTRTLWIHDGIDWRRIRGQDIPDYEIARDDTENPGLDPDTAYLIGDVVFGELEGRYADSDYIIKVWGIFRRDNVPIWNRYDPIEIPLNTNVTVGPGTFFYVKDLAGANAVYNGIYLSDIQSAINISQTDVTDISNHLVPAGGNGYVPLTPPPKPGITTPPLMSQWVPNHEYMRNNYVYVGNDYSVFYRCNYNRYTSGAVFDEASLFKGWTCLADLNSTLDYPFRVAGYLHFSTRSQFPAIGFKDTLYIALDTGRLYYYVDPIAGSTAGGYKHFSEEYPYIEDQWFEAVAQSATVLGGGVDFKYDKRIDEFETNTEHHVYRYYSSDKRFKLVAHYDPAVPFEGQLEFRYDDPLFHYVRDLVAAKTSKSLNNTADSLTLTWGEQVDQDTVRQRLVDFLTKDTRLPMTVTSTGATTGSMAAQSIIDLAMTYIRNWSETNSIPSTGQFQLNFAWNEKDPADDDDLAKATGNKTNSIVFKSNDARIVLTPTIDATTNNGTVVFTINLSVVRTWNVTNTMTAVATSNGIFTNETKFDWAIMVDDNTANDVLHTLTEILVLKSTDPLNRVKLNPTVVVGTDTKTGTVDIKLFMEYVQKYTYEAILEMSTIVDKATVKMKTQYNITKVNQDGTEDTTGVTTDEFKLDMISTPEVNVVGTPSVNQKTMEVRLKSNFVPVEYTFPSLDPSNPTPTITTLRFLIDVRSADYMRIEEMDFVMTSNGVAITHFAPYVSAINSLQIGVAGSDPVAVAAVAAWIDSGTSKIPISFFVQDQTNIPAISRGAGFLTLATNSVTVIVDDTIDDTRALYFSYLHGQPEQAQATNAAIDPSLVVTRAGMNGQEELVSSIIASKQTGNPPDSYFDIILNNRFDETIYGIDIDRFIKDNIPGAIRRFYRAYNPITVASETFSQEHYRQKDPNYIPHSALHYTAAHALDHDYPSPNYPAGSFYINATNPSDHDGRGIWVKQDNVVEDLTVSPPIHSLWIKEFINNDLENVLNPIILRPVKVFADLPAGQSARSVCYVLNDDGAGHDAGWYYMDAYNPDWGYEPNASYLPFVHNPLCFADEATDADLDPAAVSGSIAYVTGTSTWWTKLAAGWVDTGRDESNPPVPITSASPFYIPYINNYSRIQDIENTFPNPVDGQYVVNLDTEPDQYYLIYEYTAGVGWHPTIQSDVDMEYVLLGLTMDGYLISVPLDNDYIQVDTKIVQPFTDPLTWKEQLTNIIGSDYIHLEMTTPVVTPPTPPNLNNDPTLITKQISMSIIVDYDAVFPV